MAPTIKQAAANRKAAKAAKAVAEKLTAGVTGVQDSKVSANSNSPAITATNTTTNQPISASIAVPGLSRLAPDAMVKMIPSFDENAFNVADPLNPSESIPQISEAQHDRNVAIYSGGIRALQSIGLAYDLTREKFTVIGKRAKAVGAGYKSLTEIEKATGDYLDYQNQTETTAQKATSLDVSRHKTLTESQSAVHSKTQLDEKLKQASLDAQRASLVTQDKQNKLLEFQKELGVIAVAASR
jgi:hypothetical protein